ncbi:MAG TPA: Rieske 2Fe-2S domain-containing protein, partial [Myxococcota bacterium]|nr:Rieske 2Fe-2S domain-containing protein [Myxococcota bacterium]
MGLLKTLLVGRPNGLRAKLRGMVGSGKATSEGTGSGAAGRGSEPPSPSSATHEPAEKALRLNREAPRDVTPPAGYEVVLHKDALEPGKIIEVIIGGTAIAVARVGNEYFAISNKCPHA